MIRETNALPFRTLFLPFVDTVCDVVNDIDLVPLLETLPSFILTDSGNSKTIGAMVPSSGKQRKSMRLRGRR